VISGRAVTLTALVRDDAYGNGIGRPSVQRITAVEAYLNLPYWAGGTPISMTAWDGAFDTPSEIAVATLDTSGLSVGRHLIFVRGQDAAGYWGPPTAQWLTVLEGQQWYLPIAYR
jgi:carboxypeptidase T